MGYFDNFTLNHQSIVINSKEIYFLAASNNGDYHIELELVKKKYNERITIKIEDAFNENVSNLYSLDMGSPHSKFNNQKIEYMNTYIRVYNIKTDETVKLIKFPFNPDVHIFGITVGIDT